VKASQSTLDVQSIAVVMIKLTMVTVVVTATTRMGDALEQQVPRTS